MNANNKIKKDILAFLRKRSVDLGNLFNEQIFLKKHFIEYNPKEKNVYPEVLEELVNEGIFEHKNEKYVITEKGFDHIYPETIDMAVEQVKSDILECFRKTHSEIGHPLNEKIFDHQYRSQYNPKQKKAIGRAINKLIVEGLIEKKNGKIVLTEKGFNVIY